MVANRKPRTLHLLADHASGACLRCGKLSTQDSDTTVSKIEWIDSTYRCNRATTVAVPVAPDEVVVAQRDAALAQLKAVLQLVDRTQHFFPTEQHRLEDADAFVAEAERW